MCCWCLANEGKMPWASLNRQRTRSQTRRQKTDACTLRQWTLGYSSKSRQSIPVELARLSYFLVNISTEPKLESTRSPGVLKERHGDPASRTLHKKSPFPLRKDPFPMKYFVYCVPRSYPTMLWSRFYLSSDCISTQSGIWLVEFQVHFMFISMIVALC